MKSFSKSGLHKVGASTIAYLTFKNASFLSLVHLNFASFLIISCSGLAISAKSDMNLLMKLILSKKYCINLFLCGGTIFLIAYALSRSIMILSREITKPINFPLSMENMIFIGFNEML